MSTLEDATGFPVRPVRLPRNSQCRYGATSQEQRNYRIIPLRIALMDLENTLQITGITKYFKGLLLYQNPYHHDAAG
jgi:hypothetical protein